VSIRAIVADRGPQIRIAAMTAVMMTEKTAAVRW
jgi:hypothetical protein